MCRDFSYVADSSCNIYRHKSGLKRHSHTSICRSLFKREVQSLGGMLMSSNEDRYARMEHAVAYASKVQDKELYRVKNGNGSDIAICLDEITTPNWWNGTTSKNITKYGEAARRLNWLFRDMTRKYSGLSISPDRVKNRLNIKVDKRGRYERKKFRYGNLQSTWVPPPPLVRSAKHSRQEFRKICLAMGISNRAADLIHKTPADALFGKLSLKYLEKYLSV